MNRLYELRKKANYTQSYIANKLKIAANTYSQYENEKRQIPDELKIALADLYGVSIDYLLGRDETPTLTIPKTLTDTQIAFAEGLKDLDDEELQQIADFVDFLKNRKK